MPEPQSFSDLQSVIDAGGRSTRPKPATARVRDPKTGAVYEMTLPNARDKVRLDGWSFVVEELVPTPTSEETEEAVKSVEATKKPLVELDALRAEYAELAGKPADGRWGKKALATKIDLLKD